MWGKQVAPQYQRKMRKQKYGRITPDTRLEGGPELAVKTLQKLILPGEKSDAEPAIAVKLVQRFPYSVQQRLGEEFDISFSHSEEAYAILAEGSEILIYSLTERGLFYGALGLLQLSEQGRFPFGFYYDSPVCDTRGLKIYLPDEENIPYFKELIDLAAYYRYNTVIIEVGGAMEYKSHPEINEGWLLYSELMNEYSDKTKELQEKTFDWKKNSIHTENGGGRFLSQKQVRELVDYCKERQFDVIPEMPSLSHCDYLLTRHPELRERAEDPYPDTYCPSNPASYDLLFDLLDEVIEVFRPKVMNIGHDEYYSIALCEKCRDRDPADIYNQDVKKIADYLAGKGVRTMLWGEKLLNAYLADYGPCGGAEYAVYSPKTGKQTEVIPATWHAIDTFPKEVKILHWYWGIDADYDNRYHERGLDVTFANFRGSSVTDWQRRIRAGGGVHGGIISNWSLLKQQNVQRNGILFELVFCSFLFWDRGYDEQKWAEYRDKTFAELYAYAHGALYSRAALCPGEGTAFEFVHTTNYDVPYTQFVDGTFIEEKIYHIGDYVVIYEDKTQARFPIVYGQNISNDKRCWERTRETGECTYRVDSALTEVAYTTLPFEEDGVTWYRCVFENPHPGRRVLSVQIEDTDCNSGKALLREFKQL